MADDERRAEVEAAIEAAMPEMENRFMWAASTGNHPDATAEGAVRTILQPFLDCVRDARGDDEAGRCGIRCVRRAGHTGSHAFSIGSGFAQGVPDAARSPQGEGHEADENQEAR